MILEQMNLNVAPGAHSCVTSGRFGPRFSHLYNGDNAHLLGLPRAQVMQGLTHSTAGAD